MGASEGSPDSRLHRWLTTELGARVASAVVLVVAALVATYEGGWLFALFWLLAGTAILAEWIAMTQVEPRLPIQILFGATLGTLTFFYLSGMDLAAYALVSLAAILISLVLARRGRDRSWTWAGFVYAAVIAIIPPIVRDHPELGMVGLVWMFAVVWATDVAAYFTGRRFGGPKLWPRVSPKKTWSGFAGGLVAGTFAGLLVAWVANGLEVTNRTDPVIVAIVSAVASVASQMGDLAESALKRRFDVKDSSHLIPGHGGVMDRLDGFWAVAVLIGLILLADTLMPR
jgi:phosphatidate cytidylyltransferase